MPRQPHAKVSAPSRAHFWEVLSGTRVLKGDKGSEAIPGSQGAKQYPWEQPREQETHSTKESTAIQLNLLQAQVQEQEELFSLSCPNKTNRWSRG